MLNFIGKWWRKRQRVIDIEILWPAIKEEHRKIGEDVNRSRQAFFLHCAADPAWKDLTVWEIGAIVDKLE